MKTLYCYRSGLPLINVEPVTSSCWPLIIHLESDLAHPIYNLPLPNLLKKLDSQIAKLEAEQWESHDSDFTYAALLMSAIMYSLELIYEYPSGSSKHTPSLASRFVVLGSAARLLKLAGWYTFDTSGRMQLPKYSINTLNNNVTWGNFSVWLDDAYQTWHEWANGKKEYQRVELLKLTTEVIKEVDRESVYKKIDINKVWNWIALQLDAKPSKYNSGRKQTLRELFMTGEFNPDEWIEDDCDDLCEAVLECCDIGNDITHYINQRIKRIRNAIKDFRSSFTLLDARGSSFESLAASSSNLLNEVDKIDSFISEYDKQAMELINAGAGLPAEPQRPDYANNISFMQAQAKHRILTKRFNALNASKLTSSNEGE